MIIIALISLIASGIYLYFGFYVLNQNKRSDIHQLFSLLCGLFALWAFSFAFMQTTQEKSVALWWYYVGSPGWLVSPAVLLHFMLRITSKPLGVYRLLVIGISYAVSGMLFFRLTQGTLFVEDIQPLIHGWRSVLNTHNPVWFYAYVFYYFLTVIIGLTAVVKWGFVTKNPLRRRQALLIVSYGFMAVLLSSFTNIFIPAYYRVELPGIAPIIVLLWIYGIWRAMTRHQFLRLSPVVAAEDIVRSMSDGLLLLNLEYKIQYINPAAEKLFEYSLADVYDKSISHLFPHEQFINHIERSKPLKEMKDTAEVRFIRSNGMSVPLHITRTLVIDDHGNHNGYIVILHDVTVQKRIEKDLKHLATHDSLTNLPNRVLFYDHARLAFARAKRYKNFVALFLIDLDKFKKINDTLGHKVGDQLLQMVARRLQKCIRETDTVARLGGDEFVILLSDLHHPQEAKIVAKRITDAFKPGFAIDTHQLNVTVSIGVSIYPEDSDSIENLLKFADIAMYQVKEQGRDDYRLYHLDENTPIFERSILRDRLRGALRNNEFVLWYQPLFDVVSGKMCGVEALIRWDHPEVGIISPLKFMPVAEESGLIEPIGSWVIETACQQMMDWQKQGFDPISVAVNISSFQLRSSNLVDTIQKALKKSGLKPHYLHVEITESAAMEDFEVSIAVLQELKKLGVFISIDDFGTGYSSLTRLKSLPIDSLKIDRFFIHNIVDDPRDAIIVKAVVAMAHNLGLTIVAEGVETSEQLEVLRTLEWDGDPDLKCDIVQGFLFSKPVPPKQLVKKLASQLETSVLPLEG